jgi:L-ribulose-5-phosphate 3-epimerase
LTAIEPQCGFEKSQELKMNGPFRTRRKIIKQIAALTGVASVPALFARGNPGNQAGHSQRGFKIGAVDWELTKAGDPGALAVAARLGFDGLQVDLGDVESMRNPERQEQYKALAHAHKVEIASLALGVLNDVPYVSDPKAQKLLNAAIDIAAAMHQKLILMAFFGKGDLKLPENRMETLVGKLKEDAPKAEKAGVTLGLEAEIPVERYREIIDRVGSPVVKVYFDLVHAHGAGRDIYQEITYLADRICEFHAKDYGNLLFGRGNMDFHQVRRAMDAIGYRGWIQLEQWAEIDGEKPLGFDETHRRNLSYLKGIFPK